MKITVKKKVFKKFSNLKIAFLSVQNIDNNKKLKESIHLLNEVEHLIHLTFNKDTIKNHNLISPWAVAQEEFGKKAKHYHTSVERLLKKVLAKKSIATKNVLTNLMRYIALKHIIPFGIDNHDKIHGNLTFDLSSGKEKVSILKKLKKNALYYQDEKNVLGTKLDFWKSKKTILNNKSKSALIHFEVLPPITQKKLNEITKETVNLIKTFCGGGVKIYFLNEKANEVNV
jgi:DNA/RNA-binding domain of Phe-tRNA-synthetase-like protein